MQILTVNKLTHRYPHLSAKEERMERETAVQSLSTDLLVGYTRILWELERDVGAYMSRAGEGLKLFIYRSAGI